MPHIRCFGIFCELLNRIKSKQNKKNEHIVRQQQKKARKKTELNAFFSAEIQNDLLTSEKTNENVNIQMYSNKFNWAEEGI